MSEELDLKEKALQVTQEFSGVAKEKAIEYYGVTCEKSVEFYEIVCEKFNEHPKKYKMNCGQHFILAMQFACSAFTAGCAFTIHAIFPMIFESAGSNIISGLNETFENRKIEFDVDNIDDNIENDTTKLDLSEN